MIEVRDIHKSYTTGDFVQNALDGVSVTFRDNEFVAVLGPSGSGKTTLLNVIGGLDHADSGEIIINGVSTEHYRDADWDTYRNHHIGFVFQSYNLIPHQSILSNVELALTLAGTPTAERRERARAALERVGLAEHVDKKPSQLSGGQMQRVAIARALVNDPSIVLADEPTGALDTETGLQVMDLLSEIAHDRLVIMVTHNPELAEQYATRIIRIADGRVVDDTHPLAPEELHPEGAEAGDDAATGATRGRDGKASMSFLTALGLSRDNLLTKKGRTFLTAFAGSIGIMGIAAILALSNGVNDYIAKTEADAMSSFPLSISEAATDLTGLMTASMDSSSEVVEEDPSRTPATSDLIPELTVVSDMFATIDSNDLSSFREYLESDESGIEPHVNDIVYGYGVSPRIWRSNTDDGIVELSGSFSSGAGGPSVSMMSALSSFGFSGSQNDSFQEMITNRELLESQYDMLQGRWPERYDEAVLVLSRRGRLTDYTLYNIGVLDPHELRDMIQAVSSDEKAEVPDTHVDLSYEDALQLSFKVVDAASCYQRSESGDSWTDMSSDSAFMRELLDDAINLQIVGVIRANEDTDSPTLTEGVAYTHDLTIELIKRASEAEIVKEQLAHPDVDVFTGSTFDELREGTESSFDMEKLFTVDQEALEQAFAFDSSALSSMGQGLDLSGLSLDASSLDFDPSALSVDTSAISNSLDSKTIQQMIAGAPAPDLSEFEADIDAGQAAAISQISTQIGSGFLPWWYTAHPGEMITDETNLTPDIQAYLATPEVLAQMTQIQQVLGPEFEDEVNAAMERYLDKQLVPYLQGSMREMADAAAQAMSAQLATALQQQMATATQSIGSELSSQLSGALTSQMSDLSSALEGAFSVDADAFANAIHFELSAEDLTSLLTNYAQADQLTYDNNLVKLGYADLLRPRSIDIYPKSFDDKEEVLRIIDAYNEKMEAEGADEKTITYNDIMGALLRSVSDIVGMISTVLIAFVSISLVVSSIMIGIITYISVLERKKEIGILRAMGASKGNIANVFNAETVIEGLIAGVMAIAAVMGLSIPVNAIVYEWRGVPNIMRLGWDQALVLIAISVILTLVAGLIPSSAAAKRDPVEALRSE